MRVAAWPLAMGTFLKLGSAALAISLGLTLSMPARAVGRLLESGTGSASMTELRVAHAASPDWTRLWAQYRLNGTGRVAVVTPVMPGTFVDESADAWFEALESATAPRILPPAGAPVCGATQSSSLDLVGDISHVSTIMATKVAVLSSPSQVQTFALSQGLVVTADDEAALSKQSGPFVALVYELGGNGSLTRAIRYTTSGASSALPIELAFSDNKPDVTLFTIGVGRARIAEASEHTPDAIGFTWIMAQNRSDYAERRRELLAQDDGTSWLVETTGTSPFYQWSVLPNQAGSIPPVVHEYFERSIAHGAASGTTVQCLEPIWDAEQLGKDSSAIVSERCPDGALAIVPFSNGALPTCQSSVSAGQIDAATLVCGEADELAHALSGARADLVGITRSRSVAGSQSKPASIDLFDGTPLPRGISAPAADTNGCLPSGSGGAGGWSGSTGGSTGTSGSPGWSDPGYDSYEQEEVHTHVDASCSGSSDSSSDDSCSGDSSSSSESDDSCSGDSSDSDDSCSGDSSSSGDGDACSGDSSSGSGDGCSGDSSGADSGCSGDTGGGGSDCNVSRRAHKPKLSLWLLISAAIALPLRRGSRELAAGRRRTH